MEAPKRKRGRPKGSGKRKRIKNPYKTGVHLTIKEGQFVDQYDRVWSYNDDNEMVPTGETWMSKRMKSFLAQKEAENV